MKNINRLILLLIMIICSIAAADSVYAQGKKLTYAQVYMFQEPRLFAPMPQLRGWLDEDHYLEMKTPADGETHALMKINVESGEEEIFIDYKKWNELLPEGFSLDRASTSVNNSYYLFNRKNDLYYLSTVDETFFQLTDDEESEDNPKLSPDGRYVAYTKNKDLYVYDTEMEVEQRLTSDATELIYNGWSSWVYNEEILGRSTRYSAFWWSPSSDKIAFLKFDDTPVPEFTLFNADGVHGELEKWRYPKPGDPNPLVWLGIADVNTGEIIWVDAKGDSDQFIAWPYWSKDGKRLYFEWLNREMDNLKIYSADLMTGEKTEIYDEVQSTWVDWVEDLYLFENNSGFLLRSATDGWYHLYYYDMDGNLKARLTEGEWSVTGIEYVDEKNGAVYFNASKGITTDRHLFKVSLDGENFQQLTKTDGWHNCNVSPGGKYFYDNFSNIEIPSRIDLYDGSGTFIKNLGDSKTEILDEYTLSKPSLFTIPSGDGYDLPAIWYLPPDFDESKKYPVIISIYGGPGAGSVRNSYSRWLNNYYLAQNGIIILSVDHRGSGHFGKKGIDLMHRNLGKWEMHDYIAAVKWLQEKPFIDTNKIAINGGSYGGYVTCMALTYGADYFDYGVAEYSVTDWKLYDNVYTERYMDLPDENPEGYKFGSALEYADKYKGGLLITHGTMDDNVHMQNTLQLIDKFQDLDKNFELMLYPNERHGIRFPKWRHSTDNKLRFWFRNLLNKDFVAE